MLVAGDEIAEQCLPGSLGHGQHAEAEIDDVNRAAPVEVNRCRAPAGSDIWPDADTRYS